MAFSAISNFTQPSYELGYAIKIFRVLLLILIALFRLWGLIAGLVIVLLVIVTTKTVTGYTYLYPLLPFNRDALSGLLIRKSLRSKTKPCKNDDLSQGN